VLIGALLIAGSTGLAAAPAQEQKPQPLPSAQARELNLRAYMELLRSDLRTQKIAIITEVMQFTAEEDAAFWPIYREYEREQGRLNDERLKLVETYAQVYTKLTDATANDLVVKALDGEAARTALKQKFYARLKTAVSPRTAARAIQVENQIQLLVDLQIASSLPVAR
jgi:hypothetical protein